MDPRREQQSRDDRPYRDDSRQESRQDTRPDRGNRDQPRANNRDRDDRGNRAQGGNNGYANGNAYPANDGDADDNRGNAVQAPAAVSVEREAPRRGRPRRETRPVETNEGETFDAALLPPSLGISVGVESDQGSEEAPKPRRGRPRRPGPPGPMPPSKADESKLEKRGVGKPAPFLFGNDIPRCPHPGTSSYCNKGFCS